MNYSRELDDILHIYSQIEKNMLLNRDYSESITILKNKVQANDELKSLYDFNFENDKAFFESFKNCVKDILNN